jgi:uncharacterized glyoxalase superfamily protein PhnB
MTWIEAGRGLFNVTTAGEARRQDAGATSGIVMKVYVDDVATHFSRAKAEGVKIVSGLEDGFWGGRIARRPGSRRASMGDFPAWP